MLTKIRDIDSNKAEYLCECGNTVELWKGNVNRGHTKSCGCYRRQRNSERFTKHGHKAGGTRTQAYAAWVGLKTRCSNPNSKDAKNYSLRGITFDPRWELFENFLADMGEPNTGESIDRIDNEKGYFKSNCRWTDKRTQNLNKRTNVRYDFGDRSLTLPEWEEITGVDRMTMFKRIQRGVPLELALFYKGYLKMNR